MIIVSTHSRPKAAAFGEMQKKIKGVSFNTQPPEGGCPSSTITRTERRRFQHTAARRRLPLPGHRGCRTRRCFNTQPPEGGCLKVIPCSSASDCFNTQPPEGGCKSNKLKAPATLSFNTQPPEGGCWYRLNFVYRTNACFNTQPPEGGCRIRFPPL